MEKKKALYQMAVLLAPWFSAQAVQEMTEDYAEYLEQRGEEATKETPKEFGHPFIQARSRLCHRSIIGALAAGLLAATTLWNLRGGISFSQKIGHLSILSLLLPIAVWMILNGRTLLLFAPSGREERRAVQVVLFSAFGILALCGLMGWAGKALVGHLRAVGQPGMVGYSIQALLVGGQLLAVGLFGVSLWLVRKRSIGYFSMLIQAVALWSLAQGLRAHMARMDPGPWNGAQVALQCSIPFVLGMLMALVAGWHIHRQVEKEAGRWMDR